MVRQKKPPAARPKPGRCKEHWDFTMYVAGSIPKSNIAIHNLRRTTGALPGLTSSCHASTR